MSEIDGIRMDYEAGRLESLKEDLARFLCAHRSDIARFREEQSGKGLALDGESAVKFFILRHRTVNPQRDISDQLEEIRKEAWCRGVDTGRAPDPQLVALDWARRFSADWRAHRVTTIVYVFERDKERFLKLLG
jgi:hypothetical protein